MSDAAPRVPWTAIITTAVIVLGVLITLGSGLISVGTNTAQISINTAELIRIRAELAKIEELGTPGLQELKKRMDALEESHAALPAADARINGRIESVSKDVQRLDSEAMKKLSDGISFEQRVSKLEERVAALTEMMARLRVSIEGHEARDDMILRDQVRDLRNSTVAPH